MGQAYTGNPFGVFRIVQAILVIAMAAFELIALYD
jgi:hypothetical protein